MVKLKDYSKCTKCGVVFTLEYLASRKREWGYRCADCRKRKRPSNVQSKNYIKYREKLRAETFAAYGGTCQCCGEAESKFLSIDHINGGGTKERKALGKEGINFYSYLRRAGFPKGYQVLCHNCNLAKGFWGACPHTGV